MKKILLFLLEIFKIVILALVIVVPIRYFVFQPFIVRGASMEPGFHNGDYLIVDELTYHFRDPERGEVAVFRYPLDPSQRFIKRVIGLPGETVILNNGKVEIIDEFGNKVALDESDYLHSGSWLGNTKIKLGQEEYFVLGDNRMHSFDSRKWGVLERDSIIGRAIFRAWPLDDLQYFPTPDY